MAADMATRQAVPEQRKPAPIEILPDDVLTYILDELDLPSLVKMEGVSRAISGKVHALGWPAYALRHPVSHISLYPEASTWSSGSLVKLNHSIERSLAQRRWHAVQIGKTWAQPAIPVLKVEHDRVVLGVGGKLLVHLLEPPSQRRERGGRVIGPAREYPVAKRDQGSGADIVGLVALPDGQFGVGQYDGTLQRIQLPSGVGEGGGQIRSTAHYPHPKGSNLHTLTGADDLMMSTTSAGLVSIFASRSPWQPPSTFELSATTRAWSSLLTSSKSAVGFSAMIGTGQGISIYPLHPSSGRNTSQTVRYLTGPDAPAVSSAYSLSLPSSSSSSPSASSITHHPFTLLSSWYDSHLRLHDLRSASASPIATFSDPYAWADGSAMYSAAFIGENWIAGGGARHGTVCLFDVRWPKRGWSAFSPGGKGSPVYALQGEGGRLWGVSEKRAFVLAFDGSADPVHGQVLGTGEGVGEVERVEGVEGVHGEGLISPQARARPAKVEDRVSGWKGRGGKWSWTVRYRQDDPHVNGSRPPWQGGREWDVGKPGQVNSTNGSTGLSASVAAAAAKALGEGVIGYDHADRSVNLFDSVPVPYPELVEPYLRSTATSRRRHG